MRKTYTLATDSGTTTIEANSIREALAYISSIPKHVTTAAKWAKWMTDKDGYGTLSEDGVVLARVAA